MKFRAFRRKKDNLYYFQFLSQDNQVRLNSPSYADKDLCFNGIREVINNSADLNNYEKRKDREGNHFFILKSAAGLETGRSIRYKTEEETDQAIAQFSAAAPFSASGETEPAKPKPASADKPDPSKEKEGRTYIRENQPYLCNNLTFDTFRNESNQRYYFVFKDEHANSLMINGDVRGFATEDELENGIKAILEIAPNKKHYEKKVAKNGKHYFLLKSAEGKTLAKSSGFYTKKKEMDAVVRLVQCAGVVQATPVPPPKTDNYLPIAAYVGGEGFHTFQDDATGQYYFAFNNNDGKTFLRSEGYQTAKSRDEGIQSVIKNGPVEERWNTFSEGNQHYYTLKAANNKEIARSDYYDDEAAMLEDYELVKGESSPIGVGAAVVGGALMSALMIRQKEAEEQQKKQAKEKQKAEEAKLAALAAANLHAEQEAIKQAEEARRLSEARELEKRQAEEAARKKAAEAEEKTKAVAAALAAQQTTTKSSSGGGSPVWLIPLIIGILLIILALLFFRGCDGCKKPTPPVEPVTTDTVVQDTTPFGKGGEELGFIPGSMEFLMAEHLKAFDSTFPETFTAESIAFAKNAIRLDTKARKQLDNLTVLLKEYPQAEIEIYGFVVAGENPFYKGNKEISLDGARAGEVFNYLKNNGIEESRMEFYGNGLGDSPGIEIKLITRGVSR